MISIIVPVYNSEKSISDCVRSIISQSYRDIEIILIDDGASDKSSQICEKYALLDSRIKVIYKKNGGVSAARNVGINIANGEYLGFVDSDDWIEPNMYEVLLKILKDNKAQISTCTFIDEPSKNDYEKDEPIIKVMSKDETFGSVIDSKEMGGFLCNKLFIKEFITNLLDISLTQNEDFVFTAQYIRNIRASVFTNQRLYHYYHKKIRRMYTYNDRELTLMDSYEELCNIYSESASKYIDKIQYNALKVYLNFKARYLITLDNDIEIMKKIDSGINKHLKRVLFSKIGIKKKINVIMTYLFPRISLKTKYGILKRIEQKGIWVN